MHRATFWFHDDDDILICSMGFMMFRRNGKSGPGRGVVATPRQWSTRDVLHGALDDVVDHEYGRGPPPCRGAECLPAPGQQCRPHPAVLPASSSGEERVNRSLLTRRRSAVIARNSRCLPRWRWNDSRPLLDTWHSWVRGRLACFRPCTATRARCLTSLEILVPEID